MPIPSYFIGNYYAQLTAFKCPTTTTTWFSLPDKIIPKYNLELNYEIILVGLTMTNYPMITHPGLSCGVEYHEPNTLKI